MMEKKEATIVIDKQVRELIGDMSINLLAAKLQIEALTVENTKLKDDLQNSTETWIEKNNTGKIGEAKPKVGK